MYAGNHGLTWESDVSADRRGYGDARNHACEVLVEQFSEWADGIMWIDSDIRPPQDAITRLLFTARRYGLDFVTGVYHQRDGDYQPVLYQRVKSPKKGEGRYAICDGYPPDSIYPEGGCGFGFVYTSLKLIQAIKDSKLWDEKHGKWFPDKRNIEGGFGEDLAFCDFASRLGFQLYTDTSVQVGHTGDPKVVTQEDFQRRIKERMSEDGHTVE